MNKTTTALLGAGVLVAGLAAPLAASADDRALAFVIGAAAGHGIGNDGLRIRHVDRRHHGHGPGMRKFHWKQHHKSFHRSWARDHKRFHGRGRMERRHDVRRDQRHERHHERRHERRHEHCHDRDRHRRHGQRWRWHG